MAIEMSHHQISLGWIILQILLEGASPLPYMYACMYIRASLPQSILNFKILKYFEFYLLLDKLGVKCTVGQNELVSLML